MIIFFDCNKSCNKKIIKLDAQNDNLLLYGNLTISSISITFGIDTISNNMTNSLTKFFASYSTSNADNT